MSAADYTSLFDHAAGDYAQYRPGYPAELLEIIVGSAPNKELVWDCGTGSGQAAIMLAEHFERVVATDASDIQLQHAKPHPTYIHSGAERSTLPDSSCSLVTAANAVHWFPLADFFQEVQRVLQPNGVIAVWCYSHIRADERSVDDCVGKLREMVSPYWPQPIQLVHDRYRTLEFPFSAIAVPDEFSLPVNWTMSQFLGYCATWSAVNAYREDNNCDPIALWSKENEHLMSEHTATYSFTFSLHLRMGRNIIRATC